MLPLLILMLLLFMEHLWSSLRQQRKWCTKGMTTPRWVKQPRLCSSSFAWVVVHSNISLISFNHAMNLFVGREMRRQQKSQIQPKKMFSSSAAALASSFFWASICSQGRSSCFCFGCAIESIAKRQAPSIVSTLSFSSTVRTTLSSMYTLGVHLGSKGTSTTCSLACAKGTLSASCYFFVTSLQELAWGVFGSQLSSCKRTIVRLQMVSKIMLHSKGAGATTKVSHSNIIARSSSKSWVHAWTATLWFRWTWQWAYL